MSDPTLDERAARISDEHLRIAEKVGDKDRRLRRIWDSADEPSELTSLQLAESTRLATYILAQPYECFALWRKDETAAAGAWEILQEWLEMAAAEERERLQAAAATARASAAEHEAGRAERMASREPLAVTAPEPPKCARCQKKPRHFDDLCKRCAHEEGVAPRGKV